jgi:hypothetical protein
MKFKQFFSDRHLTKFLQTKGTFAGRNEAGRAAENVVGIVWVYWNSIHMSFPRTPTNRILLCNSGSITRESGRT